MGRPPRERGILENACPVVKRDRGTPRDRCVTQSMSMSTDCAFGGGGGGKDTG